MNAETTRQILQTKFLIIIGLIAIGIVAVISASAGYVISDAVYSKSPFAFEHGSEHTMITNTTAIQICNILDISCTNSTAFDAFYSPDNDAVTFEYHDSFNIHYFKIQQGQICHSLNGNSYECVVQITEKMKWGKYPTAMPLKEGGYDTRTRVVIPWLFQMELEKLGIEVKNAQQVYANNLPGFSDPARVCSPLIAENGTKFYISALFHPEPLEIIEITIHEKQPDDCHSIWATQTGL